MSAQSRTIEIDFDVHKKIEAERASFAETENDVLRRLLNLARPASPVKKSTPPSSSNQGWFGKGVSLPHGTLLRAEYNGKVYEGEIRNGKWLIAGKSFSSPSGALSGVAQTKQGGKTSLDGWLYWQVKRPNEDTFWVRINRLRSRYSTLPNS